MKSVYKVYFDEDKRKKCPDDWNKAKRLPYCKYINRDLQPFKPHNKPIPPSPEPPTPPPEPPTPPPEPPTPPDPFDPFNLPPVYITPDGQPIFSATPYIGEAVGAGVGATGITYFAGTQGLARYRALQESARYSRMKKYDPFEEEFGEGNALDEGEFRGGSTNIRSGLRNRFNRNNFNQTRRDYNQLEERPTRPSLTKPEEPAEIEMSEIPEPKPLVEPELPAEAETEPLLPTEPEITPELTPEEPPPVETDFPVEEFEPLEMESAEALETSVGASESIAEAFGVGGEVELTEMGIASAEVAGEEAIAGGAGAIAGEEAGIFAGAGALAPETLGLSLVVGGIVGGLIAVFAPHQHKKVKFPKAGSVKLLTDKDKKEMIKNMNKDQSGKYDQTIYQLNSYKGDYYLATTNEKDSDGHYKSVLVRRLTPNQLAKALITLQHDPNAYKGTDPAILEAMGLNPNLSKKQDPNRALNPNMLAEGVDFPDDDLLFKAMDDREKLLNKLTPMATYKQNLKKLDTLSGEDKEVFQKVLDAYAWDNNLNADGTAMSKTQIKNKGERPVIPAGETPESKKRQQEYQEYLADLEAQNKDIKERNAQAQAEYQRKLNDYQAQKKSYDEALEQYHNDVEEYNKQLKNEVDTYNSQLKEDVIEYNTELGEYNIEEARATGIPIDAPVGKYTKINIQQVLDEKGEKYTPLPESPTPAPPPPRRNITEV